MQWLGRRESSNVDDRRGISGGGIAAGGGVLAVIFLLARFLLGDGDASDLQQVIQPGQQQQELTAAQKEAEEKRARFVKVVLADTEDVWKKIFAEMGMQYQEPTLVLFRGSTQSGCGGASSQTGPFYCPADNDVYIDLSFAEDLENRFGAAGEFPMAYVVAHEVGHHVQYLLGVSDKMDRLRRRLSETEYNKYSVMMELQADFYAGLWAHYDAKMKNVIEEKDIKEALNAASAIGDDRLTKGRVAPDAFTHGTSAQRMYWFKKGFETGDIKEGNTFESIVL